MFLFSRRVRYRVTLKRANYLLAELGFSLVELLITVAIIGILATLVVPLYNNVSNRARQSEAKTLLSAIYSSEKSFYVEYGKYHSYLSVIAFAAEGSLSYNVGFSSNSFFDAGPEVGYTTSIDTMLPWRFTNLYFQCSNMYLGGLPGNKCYLKPGPMRVYAYPDISCRVVSANTFVACAAMALEKDALAQRWPEKQPLFFSVIRGFFAAHLAQAFDAESTRTTVDTFSINQEKKINHLTCKHRSDVIIPMPSVYPSAIADALGNLSCNPLN